MSLVRPRPVWMTNHPPSVLWHCWLGHQTCKNRRPYNLYCVGADIKPCSINSWHQRVSLPCVPHCQLRQLFCVSCLWICYNLSHTLQQMPPTVSHFTYHCKLFSVQLWHLCESDYSRTTPVKPVKFWLKEIKNMIRNHFSDHYMHFYQVFSHSWVFLFAWNLRFTITVTLK